MEKKVNIIGSRVRPFVENAHRHGYDVCVVDGFNDWDSARFGRLMPEKPADPMEIFDRHPEMGPGRVLFCAPVESRPDSIAGASAKMKTLNADSRAVAKCRELEFLRETATDGVMFPETTLSPAKDGGRWLVKDIKGSGGVHVKISDGAEPLEFGQYRQRLVNGSSVGACFLSASHGGNVSTKLMGIASHVMNREEFGQDRFRFGGLVYPARVEEKDMEAIRRFGERAARRAGLAGWWGADFIINGSGVHLLEINPRFTATMELVANEHGIDMVGTQAEALGGFLFNGGISVPDSYRATVVCYAKNDCLFDGAKRWFDRGARDVPRDGARFRKGEPVISLYRTGRTERECMEMIGEQAAQLYSGMAAIEEGR